MHQFQLFCIFLSNKLSNSSNKDLEKELRDVSVVNFSIPEVEIDTEDEDDESSGGGNSGGNGSVTRVKITKTVKEIIAEINLKFQSEIGDEGAEVVGEFLDLVAHDQILLSIMLNNKNKDAEKVYNEIIKDKTEYIKYLIFSPASHTTTNPLNAINIDVPKSGWLITNITGKIKITSDTNMP